eukprot:sb/3472438/
MGEVNDQYRTESSSRRDYSFVTLHCNSFHFCLSRTPIWALFLTKMQLNLPQIPIFQHNMISPIPANTLPGMVSPAWFGDIDTWCDPHTHMCGDRTRWLCRQRHGIVQSLVYVSIYARNELFSSIKCNSNLPQVPISSTNDLTVTTELSLGSGLVSSLNYRCIFGMC